MYNNVPTQLWMLLDKDIRAHLVSVFGINKTGITEIRDQDIIADGYTNEDLKAITLEKMTAYIGSEETFPRAWEITCAKAKYDLNPPPMEIRSTIQPADEPLEMPEEVITTEKNASIKKGK